MNDKIYTLDEIKLMLKEVLKNIPVYNVILFGSYARNNANKNSDLDLISDTKEQLMGLNYIV